MKKIILFSIFIFSFILVNGQTSIDYFHKAANYYIKAEKTNAKNIIKQALAKYPNDSKLKNLARKIDKLPPDQKNNKNQSPQSKQQQQQQKKQQRKQAQAAQNKMSKDNAQQILDAFLQDEKNVHDKVKKNEMNQLKKYRAEKDW